MTDLTLGRLSDWRRQARANVNEWGTQHPEELISAIVEEVGEVGQAYLEATHEDGDPDRVEAEVDDLAALLIQLLESIEGHPLAFEPLPTAEDVEEGVEA